MNIPSVRMSGKSAVPFTAGNRDVYDGGVVQQGRESQEVEATYFLSSP
ncbi:MAG TPA: hypothetical protein PLQ35_07370 [bacterium]|nr:hypothetical protein [bacterium]HQL62098.1 hypothetical protein [bacterium]